MIPVRLATLAGECGLSAVDVPLDLATLVAGQGGWEIELGVGKGRYLLRRAEEDQATRFIGVEVASKYYRRVRDRMRRRRLDNLLLVRAEALFALSVVLPSGFASAVHVYFPDPWPKDRHHKRRLFDVESIDLLLGLLERGGRLFFATDFLEYGQSVAALLGGRPELGIRVREDAWPEGARTNYEAKYEREGRSMMRLEVTLERPLRTDRSVLAAWRSTP